MRATNPIPDWQKMYRRLVTQAYQLPISAYHAIFYVSRKVGGVTVQSKRLGIVFPTEWTPK
jgi:hypothetical protein